MQLYTLLHPTAHEGCQLQIQRPVITLAKDISQSLLKKPMSSTGTSRKNSDSYVQAANSPFFFPTLTPHTIAPNPDGGSGESYCRLECWGRSTAQPTEPGTIGFTSGTQRSLLSPGLFFPSLASFGLPRSSVTPALGLPPHSYQTFVTPLPSQSAFPAGQHKKKTIRNFF